MQSKKFFVRPRRLWEARCDCSSLSLDSAAAIAPPSAGVLHVGFQIARRFPQFLPGTIEIGSPSLLGRSEYLDSQGLGLFDVERLGDQQRARTVPKRTASAGNLGDCRTRFWHATGTLKG